HLIGAPIISVTGLEGVDRTVAALAGEGLTFYGISARTGIPLSTVGNQLREMYPRVGVGGFKELGEKARESGLTPDPAHLIGAPIISVTGLEGVDRTVAALAGEGLTFYGIYARTGIPLSTLYRHLGGMFARVGVGGLKELGEKARESGLTPDPAHLIDAPIISVTGLEGVDRTVAALAGERLTVGGIAARTGIQLRTLYRHLGGMFARV
ncbi:hypothetical protein ACFOVU_09165, partial [Nocardiopsis sediminis]